MKPYTTSHQTFDTYKEIGLNDQEVINSRREHGQNELKSHEKHSIFQMILKELFQYLNILLLVAAIISMVASGHLTDGLFIIAIVIFNTLLSVVQENNASKAVDALKKMSQSHAKVKRNGEVVLIAKEDIVVGDVILVEAGDVMPADVRWIETVNLTIDESVLTGESVPVTKDYLALFEEDIPLGDRSNMGYASTIVTYGRGVGVVTTTGMNTEMGQIADMIQSVEDVDTPLQVKIKALGKFLGTLSIAVVMIIFIVGYLQGQDILELFLVSVSLAVAAIPEGLPTVITVVLALGMRKMAKKKAIVKALSAVESLGSVTVISSDKTGTLTQNKMVVQEVYDLKQMIQVTGHGYDFQGNISDKNDNTKWMARISALCSDGMIHEDQVIGDPTELALITFAEKHGIHHQTYRKTYPRIDEIPFDSERKRMSTVHEIDGETYVLVKGSPDGLLNVSKTCLIEGQEVELDETMKISILNAYESMASKALRVLGFAYKKVTHDHSENNLVFVGLAGMMDPPREEVKEAIRICHQAGIKVVMITGDHPITAKAIGVSLGMIQPSSHVLTGHDIDQLSTQALTEAINQVSIFARVSPQHKVTIVKALQQHGEITSMTGDGVNDAPALKQANIGVAMGITGTDVSKEAADMVLMDDHFTTIVDAVEEGRVIFSNIKKFVSYLVSCNVGEVLLIFVAMLIGFGSPLLAIQILWINLITDTLPAFALGLEPKETGVMDKKPLDPKAPIIDRFMGITIIFQAVFLAAAVLMSYYLGKTIFGDTTQYGQTFAFITIISGELLRSFSARSAKTFVFMMNPFSNKYVNLAVFVGFILLGVVVYVPGINTLFQTNVNLPINHFLFALLLGLIPLVGGEIAKLFKV